MILVQMVLLFPVAPILSLLNPFLSDINWEMVVVLFSAWDYSAWVRSYALFLEERLECYRVLKYDIETERLRTRELDSVELLRTIASFAAISLLSNAVSAGRGGYIQSCDTVCTHSGFKGEH
jgi:hypothetical protein